MRRHFTLMTLAAIAAPAALLAGASPADEKKPDSILPGYWESTLKLPFPFGSKTERRCIQQRDIDKFLKGPSNHIYTCVYPTNSIGDGHLAFKGECSSRKGRRLWISGEGDYTPTTVSMKVHVTSKLAGIRVGGAASTKGRRIGDVCPPGSPGSEPPKTDG
jgi:hypothetical protein